VGLLVAYEIALKGVGGGESLMCDDDDDDYVKRQNIPDCGGKIAKGSFAKFSGQPYNEPDDLTMQKCACHMLIIAENSQHTRLSSYYSCVVLVTTARSMGCCAVNDACCTDAGHL